MPDIPKAIWGFNGTERPGAVYLAAALAGHTMKGLPAFGIYGHDVQDSGDQSIPEDVSEKILRFVKAGLAASLYERQIISLNGICINGYCRINCTGRFLPGISWNEK